MLPEGLAIVEISDSIGYDIFVTLIREQIIENLKDNDEWYTNYRKQYPKGRTFPYHPNLGVTEEDYNYYLNNKDNFGIKSTIKSQLKIIQKGLEISFKGQDQLNIMNKIKIDLENLTINYSDKELIFTDSIYIPNNFNIYRSSWKGYKWIFNDPENMEGLNIWDMYSIPMKSYSITIGKIEKTGLTFFAIKLDETYPEKENVKIDIRFMIQ
ncbi:MAG: hypothetical protein AAF573_08925, partial [Bacteroidota bacterium]